MQAPPAIVKRTGDFYAKWEKESKDVWASLVAVHTEIVRRAITSIEEHVPQRALQEPDKHEIRRFLPVISQFI